MAYFVHDNLTSAPAFVLATWLDFKERVPDLHRRAEINDTFLFGNKVLPEETPRRMRLVRRRKLLPDIFISQSSVTVISSRLRDVIEDLDPGVHQILPVTIEGPHDDNPERFILNVHLQQESIVDELSDVVRGFGTVMQINWGREQPIIVLDPSRLSDVNIWREKRYPGSLLVSDTLHNAMADAGIRFFKLCKTADPTQN
jgi:hypothetical protein